MDWNSRSHRKRRAPRVLDLGGRCVSAERTHWRLWAWQSGNLSWWVPFLFTVGSVIWLGNGWIAVQPLADPTLNAWCGSLSALCGGFIFILGAVAAYLEVINRPEYLHAHTDGQPRAHPSHHYRLHQHQPKFLLWLKLEHRNFAWWLNTLQLIGALVFFIACAAGMLLPGHHPFNELQSFWMPQMIGALFFFVSSIMAMLEVQESPWRPAWNKIGWHAAVFNALGAIGFFLCAYYGAFYTSPEALFWGSSVSTLWGSAAFLASSYLMMVEVVNP